MLTPREFAEQIEGFRWREEHVSHREAQLVSWLLQPWSGGQTITPERLLGLPERERLTVEEATALALEKQARRQRGDSA